MDEKIIEAVEEAIGGRGKYGPGVLARLIIEALEAAGYAVVPVELTRKMRNAGWRHLNIDSEKYRVNIDLIYKAMIAAAKN